MKLNIRKQFFSKELPLWFRILNFCILLPSLLWPLIFFSTIFFFDNPHTIAKAFFWFFIVNIYPIYLLALVYFNSLLFQRKKILGLILPLTILFGGIFGISYYYSTITQMTKEAELKEAARKKEGYIDGTDEFKILNGNVYRYDTLIVGADAKTFETISWDWQRDKNYCYRFGKRIEYIDSKTFQLLDYHYAKDTNHVYYDENIIEAANVRTFAHIQGSQDGRDDKNCFRRGEKVDCDVLLTDE